MSRLSRERDVEQRDGERQNAVDENEKLRIFELADVPVRVFVLPGHNLLLQDAPRQVGHLEPDETEGQVQEDLQVRAFSGRGSFWSGLLLVFLDRVVDRFFTAVEAELHQGGETGVGTPFEVPRFSDVVED